MTFGLGTIQMKKQRGVLVIEGLSATPRGQKFVAKSIKLSVKSPADPKFKSELKTAVEELLN